MTTSVATGSSVDAFVAQFDASAGGAPSTIQAIKRAALDRFVTLGIPTTKNEDWHYTNPSAITDREWSVAAGGTLPAKGALAQFRFCADDWHTMVFVDGRFAAELSDVRSIAGVTIRDLGSAWSDEAVASRLGTVADDLDATFTALNTAFMADGAVIEVAKETHVERPIHLLFVATDAANGAMISPRVSIALARNANATVIESFVSSSGASYFTNVVTEATLADGATLRHYRMQRESETAYHVGTIEASQAKDSHFISFSLAVGAALSRTNVYTTLDGEGSGTTLNGLYMLDGDQHCDHQTRVRHAQPNTFSRELYKGILDGRSHGVFNGKVYVDAIAQKTDGKQTNNTLLLSETAHVDTKPQLEIFADDVKCTHGATVGQIDRTALFYLESRGIGNSLARRLLTYAFAADVLETLEVDEIREGLERATLERFV